METAEHTFQEIRQSAEAIRNDECQTFPESARDGDAARQGDVYVIFRDKLPEVDENRFEEFTAEAQVAPGNTQGSRHIWDSLEGVRMFRWIGIWNERGETQGPFYVLDQPRTLTHPEHGDWLFPAGVYEIRYQRKFDRTADQDLKNARRVID